MGLHTTAGRELCDGRVVIYQRTDTMTAVWQCRIAFAWGDRRQGLVRKLRQEAERLPVIRTGWCGLFSDARRCARAQQSAKLIEVVAVGKQLTRPEVPCHLAIYPSGPVLHPFFFSTCMSIRMPLR